MANDNASLGTASLWTSIIGIVLPGCLAVLVALLFKPPEPVHGIRTICWLLFVILELIALGCGIAARRTATGKAGLAISSTCVVILLVLVALKLRPDSPAEPPEGQPNAPGQRDK
jgi:hypothetical protein